MRWQAIRAPTSGRTSLAPGQLWRRSHARPFHLSQADPSIATLLGTSPAHSGGQLITAVGWVRTVRKQKRRAFLELGDGSTPETLQAILPPSQAEGLTTGTAVAVRGRWQPAPPGAKQANELDAEEVVIQGHADESYPIQKKHHSSEFLRSLPHLRLRTPLNAVLARMRSDVDYLLSHFFRQQGYVRLQPPIITSSDCEGAGEVFDVTTRQGSYSAETASRNVPDGLDHFFRTPKYLTVSSQLHLEAFVHEHPKVWTLSPTFRAEKSDTPRHVSEFSMLEAELRTEKLDDLLDLVENLIRSLVVGLEDLRILQELLSATDKSAETDRNKGKPDLPHRWANLRNKPWVRISYDEAMSNLRQAVQMRSVSFQHDPSDAEGFHLEHERWITDTIGQGSPVFVTHYPRKIKPFYMLPSDSDAETSREHQTAACFDLLLPDMCEVVGGSLREHREEFLRHAMQTYGIPLSSSTERGSLQWYLDLRRYGSIPHGGFGLGLDRLLAYLTGIENIKDVVQWPRYYGRCDS